LVTAGIEITTYEILPAVRNLASLTGGGTNDEIQTLLRFPHRLEFVALVIRICLGFRVSAFEFGIWDTQDKDCQQNYKSKTFGKIDEDNPEDPRLLFG